MCPTLFSILKYKAVNSGKQQQNPCLGTVSILEWGDHRSPSSRTGFQDVLFPPRTHMVARASSVM